MSKARFYEAFHADTGETPAAYLLRRRLEESMIGLVKSNFSVGHIADRFGFSSIQGFSKVFRRYVGLAPTEYRRTFAQGR